MSNVIDLVNEAYSCDNGSSFAKNCSLFKSNVTLGGDLVPTVISDGVAYSLSANVSPIENFGDDGKKLTDGKLGVTYTDGKWVALDASEEHTVTLDFGGIADGICYLSVNALSSKLNDIEYPAYVEFEVSENGNDFLPVGRRYAPTNAKEAFFEFDVTLPYCIKAAYLRVTVGKSCGKAVLISEITVSAARVKADNTKSHYPPVVLDTNDSGPWENPTNEVKNLLLGKPVQIKPYVDLKSVIRPDWNTPVTSGILTDGKKAKSDNCYDGTWFHANGADGRYFYFDLGHVSAVESVSFTYLYQNSWAIYPPHYSKIRLSEDGVNWYLAAERFRADDEPEGAGVDITIKLDKVYKARFVCFDFAIHSHLFIDEICVNGCTSLENAVSLESSLERIVEKSNDSISAYQGPSDDILCGVTDVALVYYNNNVRDAEYFRPHLGYIVDGKAVDTMFDGYLFLPNPGKMCCGGTPEGHNCLAEWLDIQDKLFRPGVNLEALNEAAGKVKAELGLTDYKYKFFVSIILPNTKQKDFEDYNNSGHLTDFSTVEARVEFIKWYIERFYGLFDPEKYPHLQFGGWYWFHEGIALNGEPDVIRAISRYVHTKGTQLFWIPWYCSPGYNTWKDVEFDCCCMQPNYAFDARVGNIRMEEASKLIKDLNMCIEMEVSGRAMQDPVFFDKYMGYLSCGIKYGYMKEAIHMYYEDGGLVYRMFTDIGGYGRIMYDYTYHFIKKDLSDCPDAVAPATVESNGKPVTYKVTEDTLATKVVVTKQPEKGSATSNDNGTVTYYPNKDFDGSDSFEIAISNHLGLSDNTVITVK